MKPRSLDDVRRVDLSSFADPRGVLTAIEGGRDIPFEIRRVYFLHDLKQDRGGHAHRDTVQLIAAVAGSFELVLSDGRDERRFPLGRPCEAVLFGPMLFIRLENISPDAVGLVLASTHYDKRRSIRSWAEYVAEIDA